MRLYYIRHADPDYSRDHLTPAGVLEADALRERLRREQVTRLYASPLGRAQATALPTARAMNLNVQTLPWLAELNGCNVTLSPWGLVSMWDVPAEVIRGDVELPAAAGWHQRHPYARQPHKETCDRIGVEIDRWLGTLGYVREGHRYRIVAPHRDRIALFAHGGLGLVFLAHLLAIPPSLMFAGFFLPTSSVTTILFDECSETWATPRVIGMGDLSHLFAAQLPMSRAGIKANID